MSSKQDLMENAKIYQVGVQMMKNIYKRKKITEKNLFGEGMPRRYKFSNRE